ncbi:serine/threonine-protein kinase [Pseudofrankia sp. DC12]|uniref:serine/threonine-protein kinase n=1 Tax=Pseudofrankia sp. DC12 TaxID=683315 RepID=UPI000AA86E70|nr:serine/threonine-protein kinase [Pseudofrankia sp. DC12]
MGRAVAVKVLVDPGAAAGSDPFDGSAGQTSQIADLPDGFRPSGRNPVADPAGTPSGDLRTRFLAEARVLAELDHPHIVRVYDYVEHAGLCLLVMEQLTGGSLRTRIATTPPSRGQAEWPPANQPIQPTNLDPRAVCAIGLTAAAALAAAHRIGVLHRDIKPDNLLFGADGMPRVADFGIAKIVESATVTTTGLIGTPRYMAPEQIEGTRLGPGTDLYALGVVLYELLCGRPVFRRGLTVPALLHHHLSVPPDPMPEVPAPLAAVVLAALAKNPANRPASAHDLALMLAAAATAVFGPGWLVATGVPVRLPDDVLTAAGHRLGDLLPGMAPGWAPPGVSPTLVGPTTTPPGGSHDGWAADDPARPTQFLPESAAAVSPTTPVPGRPTPPTGPAQAGWGAQPPYPMHTPRPGGVSPSGPPSRPGPPLAPTRVASPPRGRRRRPRRPGLLIGAGVTLVVVLLAIGLVVGLTAGGGGGAKPGYAGQQLTLDRGTYLDAVAIRRDGTVYMAVSDSGAGTGAVYKVTASGTVRAVAGVGPAPAGATTPPATATASPATASPAPVPAAGMPAAQLVLNDVQALAVAPDGTVYAADHDENQVYRIAPDGTAFVFAGTTRGDGGFTAGSGLATRAALDGPAALALGPDGSVYVAEGTRIRKITKDGLISTVAGAYGSSSSTSLGDGGPATKASLPSPSGLAVTANGSVYVADDYLNTVREITPDGIIRTVAGTASQDGETGDGGPAANALLSGPTGLALGPDGSLYITDTHNEKIRRIDPKGVIATFAGTSSSQSTGLDGATADEADLADLYGVAVDPSGAVYATLSVGRTLVRVDPANHIVRTLLAPPEK